MWHASPINMLRLIQITPTAAFSSTTALGFIGLHWWRITHRVYTLHMTRAILILSNSIKLNIYIKKTISVHKKRRKKDPQGNDTMVNGKSTHSIAQFSMEVSHVCTQIKGISNKVSWIFLLILSPSLPLLWYTWGKRGTEEERLC